MNNRNLLITAAVVLAALLLIYVVGRGPDEEPAVAVSTESEQLQPRELEATQFRPPPEPQAPASPPQITEEVPVEPPGPPEPEPAALPGLNDSDEFVREQLAELSVGAQVLPILVADEIIRKVAVLTENTSRGVLPLRDLPLRSLTQPMQVRRLENEIYLMDPASYHRFDPVVDALVAVDVDQALSAYQTLSPLLQQAYAEIGYPNRSFEEALVETIDRVLNAPMEQGPFRLVRPAVMYRFADERLEKLSDVEKLLLRMGPDNAERLKQKLREFRDRL
ncbi:MAG: DUF3014 domain-containing protein [Pseudomonadales bacterium]|nr:DUF3014 domain-containing protein [Pseudomonadales bacterium]